jgi:APA family basic amino acid/polyamine antiporter
MVPVAGSAYTYAYATLGEIVAWIIGWDLILEYGLSVAPTASSFSAYAQNLLGQAGLGLPVWAQTAWVARGHFQIDVIAAIITLGITGLVAIGIRESARANASLVIVQIVAMIVFVVALVPFVRPANLHPFAPFGFHGVMVSAGLIFFAYIGFDTVTVASEEAHRPERDVPIGIILSLIVGVLLFCTIAFVTAGSIPYAKIAGDGGAAMTDAISANFHNPVLLAIVTVGGLAGNFTVMLTSLLGQIRIFYVMARDRMLPPSVATIHPRFRTPAKMTLITGGIVAVLAAVLPLSDLLDFVNIGTLAAFSIVCAGVFVLRIVRPDAARPFRAPLAPLLTVIGTCGCVWLTFFFTWPTWARFWRMVRDRDGRLRLVRLSTFAPETHERKLTAVPPEALRVCYIDKASGNRGGNVFDATIRSARDSHGPPTGTGCYVW